MANITIKANRTIEIIDSEKKENKMNTGFEVEIASLKYAKEIRTQLEEQGYTVKLVKTTEIE